MKKLQKKVLTPTTNYDILCTVNEGENLIKKEGGYMKKRNIKWDNICYVLAIPLLIISIIYDMYIMISSASINGMSLAYDLVYLVSLIFIIDYLKGEMNL